MLIYAKNKVPNVNTNNLWKDCFIWKITSKNNVVSINRKQSNKYDLASIIIAIITLHLDFTYCSDFTKDCLFYPCNQDILKIHKVHNAKLLSYQLPYLSNIHDNCICLHYKEDCF